MKIFKNGLITGLILQLAIGPVFFFIANLTLQKTLLDGFAGTIAVTLVDYLYIILTIFGVEKLIEKNKKIFGVISSSVLIILGIITIKGITGINISSAAVNTNTSSVFSSFISVFFLTIFNPITIIFWTSLFTAKAAECNYSKRELLIFGLSAGLATPIFIGTSVILLSLIKTAVPLLLIQILNLIVGFLLILYGGIRLKTTLKKDTL